MAEKKKNRYGAWFIIILLLVGLAGFGAGGLSGNIRSIGTVGEKELSVQAYQRAVTQQIRALQAQFGSPISFQQAQSLGVDRTALNQLILNRALDNEANERGISVGDEQVLTRLRAIPDFQGGGGAFNRESYRFALQQVGQTEEQFETDIREEMSRTLLQAAVVSGIPAADAFAQTVIQFAAESRSVTWATITADDLTSPLPGPTDADLQTFYNDNPDQFTRPETRDITYVWLTPNMLQDDMDVPDAAVAQLYENRREEFVQPERRLVERLVYIGQDAADDARARLDEGTITFEGLVAERGLELADVDLGDVDQAALRNAGDAVFSADPGTVVGPFNSTLGPALFRVNAILAAQEITLEEATPELREELAADAAREVINDRTDMVIDLLAGGATLQDIADRTDMELGQINWTPDTAEGIAAYEAFRTAAADVEEGDFADVINLEDGGIFALRLDGVTPPAVPPFADIAEDVATAWRADTRQRAVIAKAEEFAQSILPLTGFDTLGLTPQTEDALTRRSFIEGTPPGFNDRVFALGIGDVAVIDGSDRAIIVRLDDIATPDLSDPAVAAQRDQLAQNAASGIAQDVFNAYANALRSQTEVSIDQATINAVNAQFQ